MPAWFRMNDVGLVTFFSIVFLLLHRYRSIPRPFPFPRHGYLGAGILMAGESLMLRGVEPAATYFTPIAWTGYLLWVDGAIFAIRGKSPLKTYPVEFAYIALFSIPLWLIFEAYNLRLANWVYVGLPQNWWARQFGYAWAFATIWPGIFETATLLRALGWNLPDGTETDPAATPTPRRATRASLFAGVALLTIPVVLPPSIGAYLFGAIWLGLIFLLEPLNLRSGSESLWLDFRKKDTSRMRALLWAGLICGIFWEFWNYWAAARWIYTVPILPEWRIFAMPVLGYLGFPPFAIECFVLFAFLAPIISRVSARLGAKQRLDWKTLQL